MYFNLFTTTRSVNCDNGEGYPLLQYLLLGFVKIPYVDLVTCLGVSDPLTLGQLHPWSIHAFLTLRSLSREKEDSKMFFSAL